MNPWLFNDRVVFKKKKNVGVYFMSGLLAIIGCTVFRLIGTILLNDSFDDGPFYDYDNPVIRFLKFVMVVIILFGIFICIPQEVKDIIMEQIVTIIRK